VNATGLIIGKFMPPHRGHVHLVDAARARVGHATIVVCSRDCEPIPGALRVQWMRELFPDCAVLHLHEDLPQEPGESPGFWELWTAALRRLVPAGPDVVFTSEPYGDELARRLGARHVCVDPARATVPASGTAIRSDPLARWEDLPVPVRPYFLKRVVVTGAESTGKTTLARRLAEHFGTAWVPEHARGMLDALGRFVRESDFPDIAAGQIASENSLARSADRLLFCDTDLNATVIYATHFFGRVPAWIADSSRSRRYDLFLLCDVDLPWVPDPQRDQPHRREFFHNWFRARLEEQGRPWALVSGTGEERFACALRALTASSLRSSTA